MKDRHCHLARSDEAVHQHRQQALRLLLFWGQALEGVPCPPQDRQLLLALGHILGRYDVQGQLDSLAALEQALEERLDQAEEERRRLGKVYGMLGVTGGLFLAILLI